MSEQKQRKLINFLMKRLKVIHIIGQSSKSGADMNTSQDQSFVRSSDFSLLTSSIISGVYDEPAKREMKKQRMEQDENRFSAMIKDINEVLSYLTHVELERLSQTIQDEKELARESRQLQRLQIVFSDKHDQFMLDRDHHKLMSLDKSSKRLQLLREGTCSSNDCDSVSHEQRSPLTLCVQPMTVQNPEAAEQGMMELKVPTNT